MSLFKVCTWWSAQCPDYESNYDSQLLHCCRFGISENEKDYVIVGSHTGYLSVFMPNSTISDADADEEGPSSGFKPTDQLLEMKLAHPVIQLSSGKFMIGPANEGKRQLVVLHPMKLSIYSLQSTEGLAEHGIQFRLNLCFEHKLTKPAFSLCHGYFGDNKSREFFCVTHMDSALSFFEHDGITYETVLAGDRHIPSKMFYTSQTDCFLMVSSYCDLECYRYQDLGQTMAATSTKKHILPTWSVCIGEYPLDIQIQQVSESECLILILCENILYGFSEWSTIKFMKRLDYSPICFCSFVAGWYYEPDARLIISIVSDSGTMLIYNKTHLIWAAQLSDVPISICRSNQNGLAGAICSLSEFGKIDVSYLGSEPQMFQVPPLNLQKINFEKTQSELIELEKEIKKGIDFTDVSMINATAERDLFVEMSIGSTLESCRQPTQIPIAALSPDEIKMVLVSITLNPHTNLDQIQVQLYFAAPLKATNEIWSFQQLTAEQNQHLDTWIYMTKNVDIASSAISVVVSFINNHSIPRVIEKRKFLPLAMFYKLCQPQKDSSCKLTVGVDKVAASSIEQLFSSDFILEPTPHIAIGLRAIYSGKVVTIVAGKHSNRYRIQSDHLPAITCILESLLERIKEEEVGQSKMKITASPPLPINTIINLTESHFDAFTKLQAIREKLKQCTIRMRLVERRFFNKLDDKKTGSIDNILSFIKITHQDLMSHIRSLDNAKEILLRVQCELSCGLAAAVHMIKLFDLPANSKDNLCAALLSTVADYPQQSWEEMTSSGLNMLNHIGPLRKNKNTTVDESLSFDVTPLDFDRFKRHLTGLLERITRLGVHRTEQKSTDSDDMLDNNHAIATETLKEEDDDVEKENTDEQREEQSDWACDVKETMDVLPRLQNPAAVSGSGTKSITTDI